MRRLWELRRTADPHLLLAAFGLLDAGSIAWVAFIGDPLHYSQEGWAGAAGAFMIDGFVFLFVCLRVKLAWYLAIFLTTVGFAVALFLIALPNGELGFSPAALVLALISGLATAVLLSPSLEGWIREESAVAARARQPAPRATRFGG